MMWLMPDTHVPADLSSTSICWRASCWERARGRMLERLGIAEDMKAKSKPYSGPGYHTEFVARGRDRDLHRADQRIGTAATDQAAAKEFITFLTSPAAAA